PSIAAVLEKEVLSIYRKALMLFGTARLFHMGSAKIHMAAAGRGWLIACMAASQRSRRTKPLQKISKTLMMIPAINPPSKTQAHLIRVTHSSWQERADRNRAGLYTAPMTTPTSSHSRKYATA